MLEGETERKQIDLIAEGPSNSARIPIVVIKITCRAQQLQKELLIMRP